MLSKSDQLKRHAPLKPKPFKDPKYLSWLHNQGFGCLVCGNTNIEVHHLDSGSRGRADNKCVILCPEHHKGRFSPHGADAKEFHEIHDKEVLEAVALNLFNKYKSEEIK